MKKTTRAIGQAVFQRSDHPGLQEVVEPIRDLEDLVRIALDRRPGLNLQRVMVFQGENASLCSVMLDFVGATRHQARPTQGVSLN